MSRCRPFSAKTFNLNRKIKMKNIESICDICGGEIAVKRHPETGEVYWTKGHNAEPVAHGRCCDKCNALKVLPARLVLHGVSEEDAASIARTHANADGIFGNA